MARYPLAKPGMSLPGGGSPGVHGFGHHLVAYNSTLAAQAGLQQVLAIQDPLFPRAADNSFQVFDDFQIAAAYAGAAANIRTRLTSASLALRGSPQVVPFEGTLLPPNRTLVLNQTADPIQLRIGENLRAEMESNSATDAAVLCWMIQRGHDFSVKEKDLRWIRCTVTVTSVVRTWVMGGPLVPDEPLEGGVYTVYGMQAFFATLLAARLVFPGQVMRPGCLGQAAAASRSDPIFWGGLGAWGQFNFLAFPNLEVLDTAAAANAYVVWLLCSNDQGVGSDLG